MEAEISNANHKPDVRPQFLSALVPMLLISIGYVDPGKWAAVVEVGARFGFDLVGLMFVINFGAVLCQYLSARIGVATGKDLAQICSDEYDKSTCMLLGIQTELSMIALDLTMILGISHGLNLMFGVDLFSCVFLTSVEAVLFPLFATLLENGKAKFLCIWMVGFVLLFYVLGVLISQPEIPLSMNGIPTKFSGESAFALMSLLGANIMPHNFYLHSSIVQQHQGPPNVSKSALCHSHFFAILLVFSGIFLLNYVLMNAAANVFYNTGLVLHTFQDAMSLMDQVFRSPIAPVFFLLVLFLCNQMTALTWDLGGQVVLHNLLGMDIPGWLHHATIRIIAIIPALYCVRTSGAEGLYQLLLFMQVMVALYLPSSVIPLVRVASSRPIMGTYKISQFVEFLALVLLVGMLGLKIIFVVEMIFGHSDWVGNLQWDMGNTTSVSYSLLLMTACTSLCLMLWLAATPLKSASARSDAQAWNWDSPKAVPEPSTDREEIDFKDSRYHEEEPVHKHEPAPALEKSFGSHLDMPMENFDLELPETIMDSDPEPILTTIEENCSKITFSSSQLRCTEKPESTIDSVSNTTEVNEVSRVDLLDISTLKIESVDPLEKTVPMEGDSQIEKDDEEGDNWEPEEASKGTSGSIHSLTSDGPGSFRSLSGKSDEGGNGTGSLSRLAGLGRAARRQLSAVLDEFWGQLYDFHGQTTQEAKAKKLDLLLGLDSRPAISSLKVDSTDKEYMGYFTSMGGRGSDSPLVSSLYDSPRQQTMQNSMDSSYRGVQKGPSSIWSHSTQMLDAYVQTSSRNILDAGERRYSSLRLPPSSDGLDYQPATVHGYQIASYVSRIAKDKSFDYLNPPIESTAPKSPSLGPANYRDPRSFALGQKLQNGLGTTIQTSNFQNLAVSRNSALQSERAYYEMCCSGPAETGGIPANTKKYHSLPDISGLSVPLRELYLSDRSAQWDSPLGFGASAGQATYDRSAIGRTSYEQSPYSTAGSTARGPLAFDELPPSNPYRDSFSLPLSTSSNTGSLWSRQPFEQFGVADKTRSVVGEGVGSRPNSIITQDASSLLDLEAKLLQSFQQCIMKLIKLEGSDWLFKPNEGADEDLIYRVAAREKYLYEAETREMNWGINMGEAQYSTSDRKSVFALKNEEAGFTKLAVPSVPRCGEGCVWRVELIISFGVWCIHRILDLSFMESRPELWGKYTYVLNRLQGIIDLAFSKPRTPMPPCFCLQIQAAQQQPRSSPPMSNGILPTAVKSVKGKCTSAAMLLDIIKDVEIAISCRKGRTGTAAGDVAFPKGKENLASVLKRYKRRLSNKPVGGAHDSVGSGLRRLATSSHTYGS